MSDKNCSTNQETLPSYRVSRIIQIHPTLDCNLACNHCYSFSAPGLKKSLNVQALLRILEQARGIGYNVVSMSGGEPFIYRDLGQLLNYSKSLGYFNSITTNAMLLESIRSKNILKFADLVAVSVDGQEREHNLIRKSDNAFQKMLRGVSVIRDNVANFGFIHTLFPSSWKILPWLTDFALENKAALLHLHPLEMNGRAQLQMKEVQFTSEDLHKIYIAHYYLSQVYAGKIYLQLDLLHKDHIRSNPNFVFHSNCEPNLATEGFSSFFKELIIDESGDILPIAHGCAKSLRIGNIYSNESLDSMTKRFISEKLPQIVNLFNSTYQEILADAENDIFNWSEKVIANSFLQLAES